VSPSFFSVLGVEPLIGPGFRPEPEYTRFNATNEAVLAYGAWQRLFGGRADVVGQSLEFSGAGDNDRIRIVGVMPDGFALGEPVDLWVPSLIVERPESRLMRQWRYDSVVARLRPGAPIREAAAEIAAISARLADTYPDTNGGWTGTVTSLHDAVIGSFGRRTWLLLGAVVVVLLVACVNVGGLLLARAVARGRETAVRVALGAGSWRLIRLWLCEAALLSAAGAGIGILIAWTAVPALVAAAPPRIPRLDSIALDRPVLVATAAATFLAFIGCALAPIGAVRRRESAMDWRGQGSRFGETPRRQAIRFGLLVTQCAGTTALVILAAMLARSFQNLNAVDPGWNANGVLSLRTAPPMPPELRRPWARFVDWSDRAIARLEALPGITRAAITTQIPLSPDTYPSTVARGRGRNAGQKDSWPAVTHTVSDGYFDVMGIRLRAGRVFGAEDRFTAIQLIDSDTRPERGVAIVTESAAKTLWPGQSPIGQSLWLPDIDNTEWREVIGVVEDIDFHGVGEQPLHHVFVPWTQTPTGSPRLVVKGARRDTLAADVRAVLQDVEPGTRIDQVIFLEDLLAQATAGPRFTSRVVALFGVVALILAAIGVHGTLAYVVRSRTREIGIRMALGAPRASVVRGTLRTAFVPVLLGGLAGIAIAVATARASAALLFEVSPLDAVSILAGASIIAIAALVAAAGPASRAARVDPIVALKAE
jgi:putative ABC transport system permease protein